MKLKSKLKNIKKGLDKSRNNLSSMDLSDINRLYKKLLKKLPDISHLKSIVLFSGLATLVILIMFAQRFTAIRKYLPTKPTTGGIYVEGMVGEIKQLNPLYSSTNFAEDSAVSLIFSGLTKNTSGREVVGDLAESWEISKDKRTYTFKLKDNIFWHDGEALDADDVYFTYKTIQNPDTNSPRLATWKDVEVKIIDEKTISFVLPNVYVSFIYLTDVPILPEHILRDIQVSNLRSSEFSTKPIGSGPFLFKELKNIKDVEEVHLQFNKNYYEGRPYLDGIVLKSFSNYGSLTYAYSRKDVDGVYRVRPYDLDREGHLPNLAIYNLAIPEYDALFFNLGSQAVKDKKLREAISLVIDKNKIISDVYHDEAIKIHSALLPGYLGFDPKIKQKYGTSEAKEVLASAGYKKNKDGHLVKDGEVVTIRLVSTDEELKNREAQMTKKMIESLGVVVNHESYPLKTFIEEMVRPRNYDLVLVTQNLGPDSDIYTFYHTNMASDPGINLSALKNRQVDKYLEEARMSHDKKFRELRYSEVVKYINAEYAALYTAWPGYLYGVSKKVSGIESAKLSNPKDRFWNVRNWHIFEERDY